jgi:hypothetical protein
MNFVLGLSRQGGIQRSKCRAESDLALMQVRTHCNSRICMCWEGTLAEIVLHPLHVMLLQLNVALLHPPEVKLVEWNVAYNCIHFSFRLHHNVNRISS